MNDSSGDGCAAGCVELLPALRCRAGGRQLDLPSGLQTLLVCVLLDGEVTRKSIEARLWPELPPAAAGKRLRQSLWRLGKATGGAVLETESEFLRVRSGVRVDLFDARRRIKGLLQGTGSGRPRTNEWDFLRLPLLSGWTSEEALSAQREWDRMRLLALEQLAEECLGAGDAFACMEFAETALNLDELCERPHRQLASAHLARGDRVAVHRAYRRYRALLWAELGVEPSREFQDLMREAGLPHHRNSRMPEQEESVFPSLHAGKDGVSHVGRHLTAALYR